MKTFKGKSGFAFLEERETRLSRRWFHYSPPETYSQMFRSPDWLLWKSGDLTGAVRAMFERTRDGQRENDRGQVWARNGVDVHRLQVVDARSLADPGSPLNYLLTYLAVTHPHEDRIIIDGDASAEAGIELPDVDFLIHDDDLVMTKYEGEPGVMYRDLYWNTAPENPGDDDDRSMFRQYADLADRLLARREALRYTGRWSGQGLIQRLQPHGLLAPALTSPSDSLEQEGRARP